MPSIVLVALVVPAMSRDVEAVLAGLRERLADLAGVDLDELPSVGLVLEGEDDLGAAFEVDRPVHVLAAHRLVDEQGGDAARP